MTCAHCGEGLPDGARFCSECGLPVALAVAVPSPQPVRFLDSGDIEVHVTSVAEAKLAIKLLRQRKKEVALLKREAQQAINAITAQRRDQLATQGRTVRGGGNVGKMIRTFQGIQRDADKRHHEARLDPHQQRKAEADRLTLSLDGLITQLEGYIAQQAAKPGG